VRSSGLSLRYCSQIRRGERTPHRRHWEALRHAADPPKFHCRLEATRGLDYDRRG
jgi:hypothetical protein